MYYSFVCQAREYDPVYTKLVWLEVGAYRQYNRGDIIKASRFRKKFEQRKLTQEEYEHIQNTESKDLSTEWIEQYQQERAESYRLSCERAAQAKAAKS